MYQTYELDSRYGVPFIAKAVDEKTTETIAYPSEVMLTCYCHLVYLWCLLYAALDLCLQMETYLSCLFAKVFFVPTYVDVLLYLYTVSHFIF
jgi:hypothetical protein